MNIALIGYGKMGHEVEAEALNRGHKIALIANNASDLQQADLRSADVAIDFTESDAVINNLSLLAAQKINVVIGTTGWQNQIAATQKIVAGGNTGCLWSSNFSIGVNIYYKIIQKAAELFNLFPAYDVFAHEFHHANKKDSPSGTAVKLSEILLKQIKRKTAMVTDKLNRAPLPHELHFSSTRGGNVPGAHSIFFDSAADTVEITHTARNRSGFALGAVLGAEWLQKKRGFFSMDDFMNDIFSTL